MRLSVRPSRLYVACLCLHRSVRIVGSVYYARMRIHTSVSTCVLLYLYINLCVYLYVYLHVYVYVRVCTCMYLKTYLYIIVRILVCTCVYTCMYLYGLVGVTVRVYISVLASRIDSQHSCACVDAYACVSYACVCASVSLNLCLRLSSLITLIYLRERMQKCKRNLYSAAARASWRFGWAHQSWLHRERVWGDEVVAIHVADGMC